MRLATLFLVFSQAAWAGLEFRLRCIVNEANRAYADKTELVMQEPKTPGGEKFYYHPFKDEAGNLVAQATMPIDADYAVGVNWLNWPKSGDANAVFQLLATEKGKVTRVLGEQRSESRANGGALSVVRNVEVMNQLLAAGEAIGPDKLNLEKIRTLIKDGKLVDGVPLDTMVNCQPMKVQVGIQEE